MPSFDPETRYKWHIDNLEQRTDTTLLTDAVRRELQLYCNEVLSSKRSMVEFINGRWSHQDIQNKIFNDFGKEWLQQKRKHEEREEQQRQQYKRQEQELQRLKNEWLRRSHLKEETS